MGLNDLRNQTNFASTLGTPDAAQRFMGSSGPLRRLVTNAYQQGNPTIRQGLTQRFGGGQGGPGLAATINAPAPTTAPAGPGRPSLPPIAAPPMNFNQGGSGGGAFNASFGPGTGGEALSNEAMAFIRGGMSGQNVPYRPEDIERRIGEAAATRAGAQRRATQGAQQGAVARGLFRSPVSSQMEAQARGQVEGQFGGQVAQIQNQAQQANYGARQQALQDAERHLEGLRQFASTQNMSDLERQRLEANLRLGYAQLQNQRDSLQYSTESEIPWRTIAATQGLS